MPRRRLGALAIFCALRLSTACADDAANAQEATLRGTVRDAVTGAGLSGAKVAFTSDTLDEDATRTTHGGSYTLSVTTQSPHGRLRAEKSGYEPRVVSVFFDDNRLEVDIALNPE